MDPTSPEFRPKFQPEPTRPESESSQSTNHRPPAGNSNDPQWRTKCRTCGEAFKSRNQLMRHLYRSHPLKPGKSKAPAKTKTSPPQPPPPPPLPTLRPAVPKPEQPQIHPFTLLAHQDQLAFVGQAMCAVFAVGMKQLEEEKGHQREGNHGHISAESQKDTTLRPSNPSSPSGPCAGTRPAIAPNHTYQGRQGNDSGSEDSEDDEDGGAALYGPGFEDPPLRLGDRGRGELDGLDPIDELD